MNEEQYSFTICGQVFLGSFALSINRYEFAMGELFDNRSEVSKQQFAIWCALNLKLKQVEPIFEPELN